MLKINLLPIEKRKLEKTPVPRFLLIVGETIALTLAILGCVYFILQIKTEEERIATLQKQLDDLKVYVGEYERKSAELKYLEDKEKEIMQVAPAPRPLTWSEVIDMLWDVISNNKRVWIEEIKKLNVAAAGSELKKAFPGAKGTPEHGVTLKCRANILGSDLREMTNFRRDLKMNQKVSNLFNIINISPDYKIEADGNSISFNVSLLRASFEEAKKGETKGKGKEKEKGKGK